MYIIHVLADSISTGGVVAGRDLPLLRPLMIALRMQICK